MTVVDNLEFDHLKATFIENWPTALLELTVPQTGFPLSQSQVLALGAANTDYQHSFVARTTEEQVRHVPQTLAFLCKVVQREVKRYPGGAFLRLGSRSPKDSWGWYRDRGRIQADDGNPLRHFTDGSERMADDLSHALNSGYTPWLFVRQWVEMEPGSEFRCFLQGGKLVGVSQYHYKQDGGFSAQRLPVVFSAVRTFGERLAAVSHLPDMVFDVFAWQEPFGSSGKVHVTLVEINPFCRQTDPCLFSWDSPFDRTIRYRNGTVLKIVSL